MHPAFIFPDRDDLSGHRHKPQRNAAARSFFSMKPDEISRTKQNRHNTLPLIKAWDRVYEKQGRLWGGAPLSLPDIPEHSRILELGCGSGKMLPSLVRKPHEVIALDVSPHACRLARNVLGERGDAEVITADVRSIPLRAGSIDVVLAIHVAAHLLQEDRALLVREIGRVLRPHGLLFFTDFSVADFRAGAGREVEKGTYIRGNGILTHFFSGQEVGDLFRPFTPRKIETRTWPMKIRGCEYPRAEIVAEFVKT